MNLCLRPFSSCPSKGASQKRNVKVFFSFPFKRSIYYHANLAGTFFFFLCVCLCQSVKARSKKQKAMEIVGDEIPLTNGEVYAIVRRCRDMRYAKGAPRFGLQSRSVPAVPQSSAHFQSRNQRGGGAAKSRQSGGSAVDGAEELAIHASIGFDEVLLIASLKKNAGRLYGPTSCYSSSSFTSDPFLKQQLAVHQPGTVGFANTVDAQLGKWEAAGQAAERAAIQSIRKILTSPLQSEKSGGSEARLTIMNPPVTGSELRQLMHIAPSTPAHVYAVLGDVETRIALVGSSSSSGISAAEVGEQVVTELCQLFAEGTKP